MWSDVTLGIEPGEFVAVLGPNGVGKSTLVKAMLGLQPLSSGSASVLGQPRATLAVRSGTCRSGAASTRGFG